jgi:hypothetical protein
LSTIGPPRFRLINRAAVSKKVAGLGATGMLVQMACMQLLAESALLLTVEFIVRIIAGLIVFPYGMQKLFGWFGGPGIDGTLKDLDSRSIPRSIP